MLLLLRSWRRRAMENGRSSSGSDGGGGEDARACCHGSQRTLLEQEVQKLQKQLQEELDLHIILANAAGNTALQLLGSSTNVPEKAQELLASIAALETTVSKLEDELVSLHFRLIQEKNERRLYEHRLVQSPADSWGDRSFCCSCDENLSTNCQRLPNLLQPEIMEHFRSPSTPLERSNDVRNKGSLAKLAEEVSESSTGSLKEEDIGIVPRLDLVDDANNVASRGDILYHPNKLSEEMVRCMRNIYLCLSESSALSSQTSNLNCVPCPSPVGHFSSLTSPSSGLSSFSRNSSMDFCNHFGNKVANDGYDPCGACDKAHQRRVGSYTSATEVSWMTVGKMQLEYAAEALKEFRVLVEQLAKIDPSQMGCDHRLAFWINVYNALIMHAYLAYGVPGSDAKLFSLMQKASYTVGGHSFSAAEIEYILLRMKPPPHRPQTALILALHKFKISEHHQKYSIEAPEPLTVFALSCGMYSSPAVRIFTADNIHEELKSSLRDYIRATFGISKGKLLVPKLLYCFSKGVVEDSLLVDWLCRFLTPEQVSLVRDSASQRKQRLLGARSFTVVPFDTRFRYLFLPDERSS